MSPSRRPSQLSLLLVGHDRLISTSAPPSFMINAVRSGTLIPRDSMPLKYNGDMVESGRTEDANM